MNGPLTNCPRCNGTITRDGDEYNCLACGWRGDRPAAQETKRAGERSDPFDQLVDACKVALDFVQKQEASAQATVTTRSGQRRRIERALAALTDAGVPVEKKPRKSLRCEVCGNGYSSAAHKAHLP